MVFEGSYVGDRKSLPSICKFALMGIQTFFPSAVL